MDRGTWQAAVHWGHKESDMTEQLSKAHPIITGISRRARTPAQSVNKVASCRGGRVTLSWSWISAVQAILACNQVRLFGSYHKNCCPACVTKSYTVTLQIRRAHLPSQELCVGQALVVTMRTGQQQLSLWQNMKGSSAPLGTGVGWGDRAGFSLPTPCELGASSTKHRLFS